MAGDDDVRGPDDHLADAPPPRPGGSGERNENLENHFCSRLYFTYMVHGHICISMFQNKVHSLEKFIAEVDLLLKIRQKITLFNSQRSD